MVVLPQWHVAYFSLSQEELKRFNYRKGDTEGLVNYGLGMEGIEMAAIFVEHEDIVKISFRSKGSVPVNALSKANFSGGGHTNAAGGKWDGNLAQAVSRFLEVLPDFAEKNILNK
jgi:phosphoesterase RecJ-like protein